MSAVIIGAVVAIGCTVLGAFLGHKLNVIHVLVNSRLTAALNEIAKLTGEKADHTGDPADEDRARKAAAEAPGVTDRKIKPLPQEVPK